MASGLRRCVNTGRSPLIHRPDGLRRTTGEHHLRCPAHNRARVAEKFTLRHSHDWELHRGRSHPESSRTAASAFWRGRAPDRASTAGDGRMPTLRMRGLTGPYHRPRCQPRCQSGRSCQLARSAPANFGDQHKVHPKIKAARLANYREQSQAQPGSPYGQSTGTSAQKYQNGQVAFCEIPAPAPLAPQSDLRSEAGATRHRNRRGRASGRSVDELHTSAHRPAAQPH